VRWFGILTLLYLAAAFGSAPRAEARPEFARRETLACGFCHIQPRGGGPRNNNGLRYARNEFKFPAAKGNLNSFTKSKQRNALVRARKMLRVDHVAAAHAQLLKLQRQLPEGPARKLVDDELHALQVRGDEMLGAARLLLRKRKKKSTSNGVEMLCILAAEYRGLPVRDKAVSDLKELKRDKAMSDLVKRETEEQKARKMLLDARVLQIDGNAKKRAKAIQKLTTKYPKSRAAKEAMEQPGDSEADSKATPEKKKTDPKAKPAK
jgi:hypothetical protein